MKKWILKNGWELLNMIILFIIYGVNQGNLAIELISGLWIFANVARYATKIGKGRSKKEKINSNFRNYIC